MPPPFSMQLNQRGRFRLICPKCFHSRSLPAMDSEAKAGSPSVDAGPGRDFRRGGGVAIPEPAKKICKGIPKRRRAICGRSATRRVFCRVAVRPQGGRGKSDLSAVLESPRQRLTAGITRGHPTSRFKDRCASETGDATGVLKKHPGILR